ncbi:MAG: DNA replication/repair protein RecF [Bacteroidales bacterium]
MHLRSLQILNYKNIEQAELELSPNINCFIGNNGTGKTNCLDAIYYLSFCKSYFSSNDTLNINHNEEFMMIKGEYVRRGEIEKIHCALKRGDKKQFKRNDKEYRRLTQHIGLLPLVIISPSDSSLITGGSDERRRYIDRVISQYDSIYLENLVCYNRVLLQRNNLLKHFYKERRFDRDTIEVYDEQLVEYGNIIFEKRRCFADDLIPVFQRYYDFVSGGNEEVGLSYKSSLQNEDLAKSLKESIAKDRIMQHTSIGIHKDDLLLELGKHLTKHIGSQGQQKTYLVALKLAQYEFIREVSGIDPILLLDDVFDKLDAERVEQIISLTGQDSFGQIFISDTNRGHLDQIVSKFNCKYSIFNVEKGKINTSKK